ncbi:hypothetical protein PEC302107_36170 [Pectobacterium araliae]|uniref:hypothetical protein n=1 Tax=Pectobacterium araliae TaxID=3073862 RepID=UPI0020849DB3|nr:hypothetical protein PEC302107_36170 [Pectobacterium carotovorum subsp. carotovorum]
MSLKISRQVQVKKIYPQFGIAINDASVTADVTYTPLGVMHVDTDNKTAAVKFSIDVSGVQESGTTIFTFDYSNFEKILDEAESELEKSINREGKISNVMGF